MFLRVSALVLGWQIKSKIRRTVLVSEYIPKLADATCGSARARSGQTTMLLLRTNLQWLFALPKHPITFLNTDVSGVHNASGVSVAGVVASIRCACLHLLLLFRCDILRLEVTTNRTNIRPIPWQSLCLMVNNDCSPLQLIVLQTFLA